MVVCYTISHKIQVGGTNQLTWKEYFALKRPRGTKYWRKNFLIYLLEHYKCCQHTNQDAGCLALSCAAFPWDNLRSGQAPQNLALGPPRYRASAPLYQAEVNTQHSKLWRADLVSAQVSFTSVSKSCLKSSLSARLPFPPTWPFEKNSHLSAPEQATSCPNYF